MLGSDEPLSQIGVACGFSDQPHFADLFSGWPAPRPRPGVGSSGSAPTQRCEPRPCVTDGTEAAGCSARMPWLRRSPFVAHFATEQGIADESSTPGSRRNGVAHAPGAGRVQFAVGGAAAAQPRRSTGEDRPPDAGHGARSPRDGPAISYAAFSAQQIYPSDENLCAVLAVTDRSPPTRSTRRWPAWAGSPPARSSVVPASCTCRRSWSARR